MNNNGWDFVKRLNRQALACFALAKLFGIAALGFRHNVGAVCLLLAFVSCSVAAGLSLKAWKNINALDERGVLQPEEQ